MSIKAINVKELPVGKIPFEANYSIDADGLGSYTHGFFKYPCKFIPHIPRWAIQKYAKGNGVVLDPFCGSGTTLVEAALLGKKALGMDFDPFSRLLSKVKSTPLPREQLEEIEALIPKLIETSSSLRKLEILEVPNAKLWFTDKSLEELGRIKKAIEDYKNNGGEKNIVDFLLVCLASIVRKVSNADDQSPKPYVSRKIKKIPSPVIPTFERVAFKNLKSIDVFSSDAKGGETHIIGDDARRIEYEKIKEVAPEGVDLVITSPPYINAFDVVRTFKLENFVLGLIKERELPEYRRRQVGTEFFPASDYNNRDISTGNVVLDNIIDKISRVDRQRGYVVYKFFEDMKLNFQSVYDNLNNGGIYCVVIGDSKIRNVVVPTHTLLIDLGVDIGFTLNTLFSYDIKNRYLRFPRQGRGGLIKRDWVVVLEK